MAQNHPGHGSSGGGRNKYTPGTDAKAQRYRTFSNVNQAFSVNQSRDKGLPDIDRASDIKEITFNAKAGDNEFRLRLDGPPSGRIILLDSCGFQYDIYLKPDRWSFNVLRDGIIKVRFI